MRPQVNSPVPRREGVDKTVSSRQPIRDDRFFGGTSKWETGPYTAIYIKYGEFVHQYSDGKSHFPVFSSERNHVPCGTMVHTAESRNATTIFFNDRGEVRRMSKYLLIVLIIVLATTTVASAQKLPPSFSYTIYVRGEPAGKSATTVKETADAYIFDSHTTVKYGEFALDLKTRTEADKETYLVRDFSFKGTKMEAQIEGEVTIDGKSVFGQIIENGQASPVEKVWDQPQIIVFENYVIAHEILLVRAFLAGGSDPAKFGLYMPSVTVITGADVGKGSELAIESETQEAICDKILVSIQNSSAFASYYDPQRGLPVYLAFPATLTEVFLDDFFEDHPVSRYRGQ
jgi:hypothetical protein